MTGTEKIPLFFLKTSIFIMMFLWISSVSLLSQGREYSFNSPGNICYFKYLYFAPDSDYAEIRRPFIFILGSENKTKFIEGMGK